MRCWWRVLSEQVMRMWLVVTDSGIEVGRVLNITPTPDGVVIVQNV
jgi:hypothetical protein